MAEALLWLLDGAIAVHLLLLVVCLWRLWHGSCVVDRLIALDVVGTLLLAVVVLMAIREGWTMWLDVAIGFAAVGFAGTVLLAKLVGQRPDEYGRIKPGDDR